MGKSLFFVVFLALAFGGRAVAQVTHVSGASDGTPQTDAEIYEAQWAAKLSAMNADFEAQIAAQKGAIDRANALHSQCKSDRDIQGITTKQQKTAATVAALSGAINAAPATIGDGINYAQAKLGKQKDEVAKQYQDLALEIGQKKNEGIVWGGTPTSSVKTWSKSRFEGQCMDKYAKPVEARYKDANGDTKPQYNSDMMIWQGNLDRCTQRAYDDARSLASEFNDRLRDYQSQQAQMAAAGSHLASSLTTLGAQGLMGVVTSSLTAGPAAESQGKIADINEKVCNQQADFALADANRKLQAIQNQQAQSLLDFNVAKASQDLARKLAANQRTPVGAVAAGEMPKKEGFPFDSLKSNGGSAPSAGGGAGGGGGSAAGSPNWGFGGEGDGEEPGGSPLPESPAAMAFNGEAAGSGGSASTEPAGGFGTFAEGGKGPEPASAEGETAVPEGLGGDGGLNTLMNRMRAIHAKYAATLLQSQDLSQVATGIKSAGQL